MHTKLEIKTHRLSVSTLKQHWCLSKFLCDDLSLPPLHTLVLVVLRPGGAECDLQGHSRSLALFHLFEVHVHRHLISFGCISRETELDVPLRQPADGHHSYRQTADVDPQLLSQL